MTITYSKKLLERELASLTLQLACDKQSFEISERAVSCAKPTKKALKHHAEMVAALTYTQTTINDVTRALLLLNSGL